MGQGWLIYATSHRESLHRHSRILWDDGKRCNAETKVKKDARLIYLVSSCSHPGCCCSRNPDGSRMDGKEADTISQNIELLILHYYGGVASSGIPALPCDSLPDLFSTKLLYS
jgi:hypothetical protein